MFGETLCRGWNSLGVRFWSIGYKKRIALFAIVLAITISFLSIWTFFIANLADLKIIDQGGDANGSSVWDEWVRERGLKSVADIYDSCEPGTSSRKKIGKIIVHFDAQEKRVVATALANFTARVPLTAGVVHVVAKFHGRTLHDVKHKVCKVKAKSFKCPISKGQEMRIDESFKLPKYIPKGEYKCTAKLLNEEDVCLGMTESDIKV